MSCSTSGVSRRYAWVKAPLSRCSASCGGRGTRMVRWVCEDEGPEGGRVADGLCDEDRRPEANMEACNTHACPPRYPLKVFFYLIDYQAVSFK